MKECRIGSAEISDHNALYNRVMLKWRSKNLNWRLHVGILNNPVIVEQIREEIKRYLEENDTGDIDRSGDTRDTDNCKEKKKRIQ